MVVPVLEYLDRLGNAAVCKIVSAGMMRCSTMCSSTSGQRSVMRGISHGRGLGGAMRDRPAGRNSS
jgi:hypothetical protein